MTAGALLEHLRSNGIALYADGGRLRWRGPVGVVSAEVKDELRQHKVELLEMLTTPPTEAELLETYGLRRCWRCRRILVERHVEANGGGWACRDRADCRAATAVAHWHRTRVH